MISRLTAVATTFAVTVAAAATLTISAHAQAPVAKTVKVIELPSVVVVAHRLGHGAK